MDANDLVVSPNPFKDKVHFISKGALPGNAQLGVTNVLGQIEYFDTQVDFKQDLNLHDLQQGLYYLKVTKGGEEKTFKIVKE